MFCYSIWHACMHGHASDDIKAGWKLSTSIALSMHADLCCLADQTALFFLHWIPTQCNKKKSCLACKTRSMCLSIYVRAYTAIDDFQVTRRSRILRKFVILVGKDLWCSRKTKWKCFLIMART